MPATPDNIDRINASTVAVPVSDRHPDAVPTELSANHRWRARNEQLISWREACLNDPGLTDAQPVRLRDQHHIRQDPNNRLLLGHRRLAVGAVTYRRPQRETVRITEPHHTTSPPP